MNVTQFLTLYIILVVLEYVIITTLSILNINSMVRNRDIIPEMFRKVFSVYKYKKAVQYNVKKEHYSILHTTISTATSLAILFSGLLGWLEGVLNGYFSNQTIIGLLFLGILSVITFVLDLPLRLYSIFVIEEEFGFNKMTLKSFVSDNIKEGLLGAILGSILLTALFTFMDRTGSYWWVWASGFFILFQLIIIIIYPNFIAPLFNKFSPLEEGELKESLDRMAQKAGFNLKEIYIMDGSRRSAHSNAYFTGIGKSKRIVLYDTLVNQLSVEELTAVLAHEIGHWKKGHIRKRLLKTFLMVPLMFFILSLLLSYNPLFVAFGLNGPSYYGLLTLVMLISSSFTFFLAPIGNHLSRKDEFEADRFAKEISDREDSPEEDLIEALFKLSSNNLGNLTPDKLYSKYHYSHPPLIERISALRSKD